MSIAEFRESSKLWTNITPLGIPGDVCLSVICFMLMFAGERYSRLCKGAARTMSHSFKDYGAEEEFPEVSLWEG